MSDGQWAFDDPPNVATITTRKIINGEHFIDYVAHDGDDGGWQFLSHGGGGFSLDDALVVGLSTVVSTDASLNELADLPVGWCAVRKGIGDQWVRARIEDSIN